MSEISPDHSGAVAQGGFGSRAGAPTRAHFVYDGRLGELYWIFIKNTLLMLVTFSIWRFWGKTRIRRYLWSHTSLAGDRFEYTGTGGELFVGFIIVMIAYVLGSIGIQALGIALEPDSPILLVLQLGVSFLILYLVFVAQYAAQRYRLTRTLWRGINGGMTGSAWKWGMKGMWFSILSLLSLTLAWPWAQMRLLSDRVNHSYFGDAKASATLKSANVYKAYFVSLAVFLVTFLFVGGFASLVYGLMNLGGIASGQMQGPASNSEMVAASLPILVILIAYVFIAPIAYSFYVVAVAREVASTLELGGLRFATPITTGRLVSRYFWNIVIIVFTFGLGLPIAIHRTMLFLSRNIEIIGEIDGSAITRAELPRPKFGEGLLEAFDPGIL
ncbi:YjgN family protein [Dongia sp.]|uniref:YjgN family protein n=1 Tax=Dongia sp. TaxID=1977262 RepID=UPI0035B4BC3E